MGVNLPAPRLFALAMPLLTELCFRPTALATTRNRSPLTVSLVEGSHRPSEVA